jgi:flavodoxin
MRAIIVYDSESGNTKKIAEAIAEGIENCKADLVHVGEAEPGLLAGVSLLFVGSPTRNLKPTDAIMKFIDAVPDGVVADIAVAAFDTRVKGEDVKKRLFRFMADSGGYAANHIAEKLRKKGGILILPPEGFFVEGESGPLKQGESERASLWAKMACHA